MPDVQAGKRSRISLPTIKRKEFGPPGRYSSFSTPCHARYSIKPLKFEAAYLCLVSGGTAINVAEGPKPKQNPDGSISLGGRQTSLLLESEPYTLPERELMPRFEFYYGIKTVETYWRRHSKRGRRKSKGSWESQGPGSRGGIHREALRIPMNRATQDLRPRAAPAQSQP